jgi:hypothetical protein
MTLSIRNEKDLLAHKLLVTKGSVFVRKPRLGPNCLRSVKVATERVQPP